MTERGNRCFMLRYIHQLLGNDHNLQQSNSSLNNGRCRVISEIIMLATTEELLLGAVFSVQSVQKHCN
jgi:hypothetical protein